MEKACYSCTYIRANEGFITDGNVDYAELYLRMARATEKAIRILVEAQQECEELYIRAGEDNAVIKLDDHRSEK